MPPPASLTALFENGSIPDDWETVSDSERFYVGGLRATLRNAGLRAKVETLIPALPDLLPQLEQTKWTQQLPSNGQWAELKKNPIDRACRKRLLSFPKAALVILAADIVVTKSGAPLNVYDHVCIVPATSYISDLTFEIFEEFKGAIRDKYNQNPIRLLKRRLAQQNDGVFHDIVRGKTVTERLASELHAIIVDVMPQFGGVVSDDFEARIKSIKDLRDQDRSKSGKKSEIRYARKISSSSNEVFWG